MGMCRAMSTKETEIRLESCERDCLYNTDLGLWVLVFLDHGCTTRTEELPRR